MHNVRNAGNTDLYPQDKNLLPDEVNFEGANVFFVLDVWQAPKSWWSLILMVSAMFVCSVSTVVRPSRPMLPMTAMYGAHTPGRNQSHAPCAAKHSHRATSSDFI